MPDNAAKYFPTPILFMIYNRPDLTRQVFKAIKHIRPSMLFIAADGPNPNRPEDAGRCVQCRNVIADIDWDCDVQTLFRDENLGSGRAVSSAITWFFDHTSEGIILEDDCLPTPDFFKFCAELLERYRFDTRVMEIGGTNFIKNHGNGYSYSFSNHNMIWGWATWKRAWQLFDFQMTNFKALKKIGVLKNLFSSPDEREWFMSTFERSLVEYDSIWDYQWEFSRRINSGLSIVPGKNLVLNIGLGKDATHTFDPNGPGSELKAESMAFPLVHPPFVMVHHAKEREFFIQNFTTFRSRVKLKIRRFLPVFNHI